MNEAEILAAFERYLQSLGLGHGSATLSTSGVFEYMPFVFQAFRAAYIQQSTKIDQLKFDKEILANTVGAVGDDYKNFRSEIERLQTENAELRAIKVLTIADQVSEAQRIYDSWPDELNKRIYLQGYRAAYAELSAENEALRSQNKRMGAALDLFLERMDEPPAANCSCHISPPCNDCMDYAGLREAFEDARNALIREPKK
jgi:hypothetical protein